MDEVNLDEFLKEASAAIDDQESLAQFFREKVTIAIERFLVRPTSFARLSCCVRILTLLRTELLAENVYSS
jgi:hypothetical protein